MEVPELRRASGYFFATGVLSREPSHVTSKYGEDGSPKAALKSIYLQDQSVYQIQG